MSFWTIFAPLSPSKLKIQNFGKNEKTTWIYYHFANVYHKWNHIMYGSWETEHMMDRICCYFDHYWPFYLSNNPKYQSFEEMSKALGDIIVLHMCTINHNHMMYSSWNIECDGQNILSFWIVICPFTHQEPKKLKFEKMKKNT